MENIITVKDKEFKLYIPHQIIIDKIDEIALQINKNFVNTEPLFLSVLNGSFMFAAELYQRISLQSHISFVKVSSYSGMESTKNIKQLIGFDIPIQDRDIIIIEDIIDTGFTMKYILKQLKQLGAKSISIVTLFFKPDSFEQDYKIDYIGFEIPDEFIVGFGLDYDGYGRNHESVYIAI
ncbi:MAG: hypoxanthine phosphoribosyltransferase [Bacteroidales bacterium]|jgi:hypoxanthine phosphoribosyltransferase